MTGAILAGGMSRRMGRDKALVEVGGVRLIDRIVELYREIFTEVLVVTNDPSRYLYLNVRLASDLLPGRGALGGLHAALFFATSERVFAAGCDMPFLNPDLIRYLIQQSSRWDVVVPQIGRHMEPLHAVYSRRCLRPVEDLLQEGGRKIIDVYPRLRVRKIPEDEIRELDPEFRSFLNINTPDDLAAIAMQSHPGAGEEGSSQR